MSTLFLLVIFGRAAGHWKKMEERIENIKKDSGIIINPGTIKYNFDIKSINIDVKGNRGVMGVELEDVLIQGKKLFVINVHFPWKPIYEYEKAKIMQFIFDFILQRNDEHIIIAGDFNSLVNSVVVRMIYYEEWYNELNRNMKYIGNFIFNKKELFYLYIIIVLDD